MSRKTRKLIWSAPLVAVLAVAGALALFVALGTNGAQAHEAENHGLPGYVTGVKATADGKATIKLTWNAPTTGGAPTRYRIDVSIDTQKWVAHHVSPEGDTATNYTDTMGLKPGMTRYYRVFAMNAFGTGPVSFDPTYHFGTTTGSGAPDRVAGLSANAAGPNQINLSWTAPDDNGADIVAYRLLVQTPTGPEFLEVDSANDDNPDTAENRIVEFGPDVRSYQHKDLLENSTYRYVVYAANLNASNGRRYSNASNERGATTPPGGNPDVPANLKAVVAASNNAVSLYWTWPTNLRGGAFKEFQVARSIDGTFDDTGTDGDEIYETATRTGASQYDDTTNSSLADGAKVYYRVRTVTTKSDSGLTEIFSSGYVAITVTMPRSGDAPEEPTLVSASQDKLRQIDLAWSAAVTVPPSTTTGYLIEASKRPDTGETHQWMRVRNGNLGFSDPTYNHYDLMPRSGMGLPSVSYPQGSIWRAAIGCHRQHQISRGAGPGEERRCGRRRPHEDSK